jgi:hypothetical protein
MTPDEYIYSVVSRYRMLPGPQSPGYRLFQQFSPLVRNWAGQFLLEASFSGSYAKDTMIKGSTDLDLFISLSSQTPYTLRDIYDNLYECLLQNKYEPRKQNVSIGITYSGYKIDLIPGRKQSGNTGDHSLYRHKARTWTQTNIQTHIKMIRNCGRLNEIRAVKIWRNLNGLDFPSFYLELTVLNALGGMPTDVLGNNVLTALQYLRDKFTVARVVDPANSNNIISEDLAPSERLAISNAARNSLTKSNWSQIIW